MINGLQLQGNGGTILTSEQLYEMKKSIKKSKIEETTIINETLTSLNRNLNIK